MPSWGPGRRGWGPGPRRPRPGQGCGHERHGGHGWRPHRRRWGLRRRLNFTFAFVALAAVGLTTWLTLGAVFQAQRELFSATPTEELAGARPGQPDDVGERPGPPAGADERHPGRGPASGPEREAFRGVARTSLLAALLSFVLATVVAGSVTRRLTRPLLALEGGARRLEAGERGLQLPLPSGLDELRSLTAAFNSLVGGLERQESWRRSMVADIAHDLRTPLSVLRSELEAMQDGVRTLDEAGLTRLHREVMTLSHLVDDLRTLSLAEGGGLGLDRKAIRLAPFLQGLLDAFGGRAAESGAALSLHPVPEELTGRFDPERLGRVLNNLIDNALRHAVAGPSEHVVEVSAEARGDELRIAVRDHGPGLPVGEEERIFERFYRADPARSRQPEGGSGLGLSIARAVTESHGGRLEAADHPQGGAVFTVILPDAIVHEQGVEG